MIPLGFTLKRVMDAKVSGFGTGGDSGNRSLDLTDYGFGTVELEIASALSLKGLDPERIWVQCSLVKIPPKIITRGKEGLVHQQGLYTVFVKVNKDMVGAEYIIEAVSSEVEKFFGINDRLVATTEEVVSIGLTYQQPTPYLNGSDGRYWNRVFIECEIYNTNN